MTGREKLIAVFRDQLESDFPVVIPYQGIFLRDHWEQVTDLPWWIDRDGDIERMVQVRRSMIDQLGTDWVATSTCSSRDQRETVRVKVRGQAVSLLDTVTGREQPISRPPVSGVRSDTVSGPCRIHSPADIDREIIVRTADDLVDAGQLDLAEAMCGEFHPDTFLLGSIGTPLWHAYGLFGFEQLMTDLVQRPALVESAVDLIATRNTEVLKAYAQAGVDGIWIEDCLTSGDIISLEHYRRFQVPFLKRMIDQIHASGMMSIYYFCGDPHDRLADILDLGAHAVSFEESKKGFEIDLAEIDEHVARRSCLLGNFDAMGVLPSADEATLRQEIAHQVAVGRRHGRFAMSLGSPVTPGTSVSRLQRFVELTREIAAG